MVGSRSRAEEQGVGGGTHQPGCGRGTLYWRFAWGLPAAAPDPASDSLGQAVTDNRALLGEVTGHPHTPSRPLILLVLRGRGDSGGPAAA